MLNAYKSGIISEERMTGALTRILGLKAHMGLHKKAREELVPSAETLPAVMQTPEFQTYAPAISRDALTLVKYKDEGVLPLDPNKTKRVLIVHIKGADSPLAALGAMMMGGPQKNPAETLRDMLNERGFEASIYVSPLDTIKAQLAAGEKPNINLYFAGKNAIEDFVAGQDIIISLYNVLSGRPSFGMSKGGGEIPWYVFEQDVIGISVNTPTMLADVPMLRTYINAYDSKPHTMEALVDALLTGPEAFKGKDPIDSYCGLWDARL